MALLKNLFSVFVSLHSFLFLPFPSTLSKLLHHVYNLMK